MMLLFFLMISLMPFLEIRDEILQNGQSLFAVDIQQGKPFASGQPGNGRVQNFVLIIEQS